MRKAYSDASENVYDVWGDSYIRKWLLDVCRNVFAFLREGPLAMLTPFFFLQHGVIRTKQAKTRDELLDLMARNYYGARDTTYSLWTDNQLRKWLESRGLLNKVKEPSRREQLEEAVSERYFELRDNAYSAWDESLIKDYLQRTSDSAHSTAVDVAGKRDEMIEAMKSVFYTANDHVWDTWSNNKMRKFLVDNDFATQAQIAQAKRHELEELLSKHYSSAQDVVENSWSMLEVYLCLVPS